ncbi:MAG: AI-2E family transporter [Chloroflexota bacterium]
MTDEFETQESPPWSATTKFIVTVAAIILLIYVVYTFQSLVGQIVGAAILAYILNPIIVFLDSRTPLQRGTSIIIVYLLLAGGVITAVVALSLAAINQVTTLIVQVPDYINGITAQITTFLEETPTVTLFDRFTINLSAILDLQVITDQLLSLVNPVVGQSTQIIQSAAGATIAWLTAILFIFVISIYIAIEIPGLGNRVARVAHLPGYQKDAERMMREFGRIWSAYLRGQVILGIVIFLIVWIGLAMMGVQNSFALGILSGLLEFIPILGPIIGAGAAVIVAFFQEPGLGMSSPFAYAGIVLAFMIIVQQVENAVLVPKIVGESLDLHPIIVMVAVFMGSTVAGILGAILATPITATIKMLSIYAWRKMFDQNPFPEPEEEPPPEVGIQDRVNTLRNRIASLSTQLNRGKKTAQSKEQDKA